MSMFCYQCEQSSPGGCSVQGVCGKDPQTAVLQDLLLHAAKGTAMYAHRAWHFGARDPEVERTTLEALFSTMTNVNFDPERLVALIKRQSEMTTRAQRSYWEAAEGRGLEPEVLGGPASWKPATTQAGLLDQALAVGLKDRIDRLGAELSGLGELLTYGLKGLAAYAMHAHILGRSDAAVFEFLFEALDYLTKTDPTVDRLLVLGMKCGEMNLRAMGLLDDAHTSTFGHPEPTRVRVEPRRGKAILVSGHDLKDLEGILEATAGTGIQVYTHGELLTANAYPRLKRFGHLAGHFGGAWQDQAWDFEAFPGPIVVTTNCIQAPQPTYKDRLFTTGLVAWPGIKHLADCNFGPVVEVALAEPGFAQDGPDRTITIGFAHNTVMSVADKVVGAVKEGKIRHFFLIGGCDGAKPGRNYYTDLARSVPDDCVILTLACGKFRFNRLEFGDIGGIPRLLDIGQCNDAYSAIRIAVALAHAFDTDVNHLPLSMILSWYEQKAVAILLTLLHLGIRNIRLGPSLPAFVSPGVLNVLVEKFGIMPISTPDADLQAILQPALA